VHTSSHTRPVSYSVELVQLNKHQISGVEAYLHQRRHGWGANGGPLTGAKASLEIDANPISFQKKIGERG